MPVSRGLSLIKECKWLDALNYFKEASKPPPQPPALPGGGGSNSGLLSSSSSSAAEALLALCRAELRIHQEPEPKKRRLLVPAVSGKAGGGLVQVPMTGKPGGGPSTADGGRPPDAAVQDPSGLPAGRGCLQHPAQHLASALVLDQHGEVEAGKDQVALSRRGASNAQAAGEALAFLLHPAAAQLPQPLHARALALLSKCTAVLGDYRAAAAVVAGNGGAAAAEGARKQSAWERRAEKTASFKKVLALTGLAPVKQALAELADKVRGESVLRRLHHCLHAPVKIRSGTGRSGPVRGRGSWFSLNIFKQCGGFLLPDPGGSGQGAQAAPIGQAVQCMLLWQPRWGRMQVNPQWILLWQPRWSRIL